MSQLIEETKRQRKAYIVKEQTEQTRKAGENSEMLVSVLEEQFKAMETWLLPMTHGEKKDKDEVIVKLMKRFKTMSQGYNKLIQVLSAKRSDHKIPTVVVKKSPQTQRTKGAAPDGKHKDSHRKKESE